MRRRSVSSSGLWSTDRSRARPARHSTARLSPAFATHTNDSPISATHAVVPLSSPGVSPVGMSTSSSSKTPAAASADDVDDSRDDEEKEEAPALPQSKSSQEQSRALDRVAAVSADRELDADTANLALASLKDTQADEAAARKAALKAVKVDENDVKFLSEQLEIPEEQADHRLREANNDLKAAIRTFIRYTPTSSSFLP